MPTLNFTHIKVIVGAVTSSPCDDTIIILTDYPSPQAAVYGEPAKAEMVIRVPNSTGCDYARQHFGYEPEVVDRYGTLATQIEMVDANPSRSLANIALVTIGEFIKQVYDVEGVIIQVTSPDNDRLLKPYPNRPQYAGQYGVKRFLEVRVNPCLSPGMAAYVMDASTATRADWRTRLYELRAR